MPRPLMQKGIAELEAMFGAATNDVRILKQLEAELRHRQVPRAVALLLRVQTALPAAGKASARHVEEPPQKQIKIRAMASDQPAMAALPVLSSIEAAYQTLKVPANATWEAIEMARRKIVDLAHPNRVAALAVDKRTLVQETARHANAAYAALHRVRTSTNLTVAGSCTPENQRNEGES